MHEINGNVSIGRFCKILGIVTEQITSPDKRENIGLTWVVPAVFIKEAIDLLPRTP